jgi:transcriptional regulator with XRE-family HTH domain
MEEKTALASLGKRIYELRKQRGLSQPEVGRLVGTSGAIIGRYERGEMTPSIEVARKLAKAFSVTLDYLVSDEELPTALKDRQMLERWLAIDQIPEEDRQRILYLVDGLIRDARARQTYKASA